MDPIRTGNNRLFIVSGYASPAMVYKHLQDARSLVTRDIQIRLIVGMAAQDGITEYNHSQFVKLALQEYPGLFECWYMKGIPPLHSKTYAWLRDATPRKGFVGSANYSQSGFFGLREAISKDDPNECHEYFESLLDECISCVDPEVPNVIQLVDTPVRDARAISRRTRVQPTRRASVTMEMPRTSPVRLSLLDDAGKLPNRSGLNWGQRSGREPNQAYIRVPAIVARSGFFPPRGRHFTILTDDGVSFDAVIAQGGDKAIETPQDNSILGKYFRERIGKPLGALVTVSDLRRYGRTHIDFVKIDDETYYLNFSV